MHARRTNGFTLLELSVVVAIISVILAVITSGMTVNEQRRRQQELSAQLDAIEGALAAFRLKNSRLPCPMVPTLADNNASFGLEAATPGTCTSAVALAANVVAGVVPIKTLGLPDSVLRDPWGRRISYAVDTRITAASAFSTYEITNGAIGSMEVRDASNTARTTKAIAVVFSHGANGQGAYGADGSRFNAGITNTQELENCNCTSAAAAGTLNNVFFQRALTGASSTLNRFDDTLRYYTRSTYVIQADLE